ncbi:hypothetical protein PUNSTDRAFT_143780 [Punctularia strigosozonata HHB-11173 SS5]|uniref:uncharacterized protein n=1 Tax=Punctularia strigosozonata (strain HHB-11173) TaxID=741275 RepID=UPI0004417416|nr:uncharacterized protein PUNSTDRAFT_143780 [Punctularia strigosozonata HHB-11173 SS5]EIN09288.1 hypothetical protein PUNSTDRAFT_143780 [Punctularia strigosozonata HHB-11173 SS5]
MSTSTRRNGVTSSSCEPVPDAGNLRRPYNLRIRRPSTSQFSTANPPVETAIRKPSTSLSRNPARSVKARSSVRTSAMPGPTRSNKRRHSPIELEEERSPKRLRHIDDVKSRPTTRSSQRRHAAIEPEEELPKRLRHIDEIMSRSTTRSNKRRRSPVEPEEESPSKKRRHNDVTVASCHRSKAIMGSAHAFVDVKIVRRKAKGVDQIVVKTEKAVARAMSSVRNVLANIAVMEAPRVETPPQSPVQQRKRRGKKGRAKRNPQPEQPAPPRDDPTDVLLQDPSAELESIITLAKQIGARISSVLAASPTEDLRPLYAEFDALQTKHPIPHICPRTASQQKRADIARKFPHPRPRLGVDAQGIPFEDWGDRPRPRDNRDLRVVAALKERVLRNLLPVPLVPHDRVDYAGAFIVPAPIRPRRPRRHKKQFTVQFHHIPKSIFYVLEAWNIERGRCSDCFVRAVRFLPPWVLELHKQAGEEEGNPTFLNELQDEFAEWDEERRQWRHLVMDHYRWIPVEELEVRPRDDRVDPAIINGTVAALVPDVYKFRYDSMLP